MTAAKVRAWRSWESLEVPNLGWSPDSVLSFRGTESPSRLRASSYGQGTDGPWGPLYTNPSLGSYLVAYQKWDLQAAGEILIHQLLDMVPFLCSVEIQGAAKRQGAVSGHVQLTASS